MLIADKVSYGYPSRPLVLRDVSLSVAPGERVALRAQSGVGKTTLCRILAGYLAPASGRVLVDGRPRDSLADAVAPLQAPCFTLARRCPVQLIWQHPEQAFDPLLRVGRSMSEAGEPRVRPILDRSLIAWGFAMAGSPAIRMSFLEAS